MKTIHFLIPFICAALFTGCATAPPSELIDARLAYQQASESTAKQLVPADLHKAREALNLAEQSFEKDADSQKTRDLAYVAKRKSEQAIALGATAAEKASQDKAEAEFQKKQAELVQQGRQDLVESQKRTAAAQAELERQAAIQADKDRAAADYQRQQAEIRAIKEKSDAEARRQQAEIAKVQQDLKDAEMRTAATMAELEAIAAIREEERGSVLTLSGGVLFRSGEATLMPSALASLDQVAKALQSMQERKIIVEGHTDSRGSAEYNQGLSERRANAVRDYLVQRGLPADRIRTSGKGQDNPIADNASPEGRANNRRVEIVIER